MAYLKDRVHTIREFGVKRLPALIQAFKTDWALLGLLNKLTDGLNKENGYLFRITALYSL